ncbi:altronate dehydratase [Caballeronia hypogeia]|uniref:Altronate dehydratase n=1 Tax=Caballeronia hypogeia TaxID=1777140 RepID=A0A158AF58_9BURK|nr:UxaA family hydrolase [Caballeronia hypogeia]SAK56350.1 altronate dehydratase [Caballeronia hypogeia]
MTESISQSVFMGYPRANGNAGTRNYLGVVIVGNCAATAARQVARAFTAKRLAAYANVDGVVPFVHELGCGMEKSGEPMDLLRRTLGGSIRNPNLAGALVLALGCERNNIYGFLEQERLAHGPMLKSVVLQEVGGTAAAIEQGVIAIESMLDEANRSKRVPVSLEHLVIGLQADDESRDERVHRAMGLAVDKLVAAGGTAIATDTRGSARSLMTRTDTPALRELLEQRIEWWGEHTAGRDTRAARQREIAGSAHIGSSSLQAVFGYAHPAPRRGLVFMDSPRHEAVCSSGLVAAGANLVSIASRDTSTFGATAAPTVKLALDAEHDAQFNGDLDIHADDGSIERHGDLILSRWIAHASGDPTRSEELGVGEAEFAPWHIGVLA